MNESDYSHVTRGTDAWSAYARSKRAESRSWKADLTGAALTDADLTAANLRGANLTGAALTDADLTAANLRGANLTGANLRDADLTAANLRGANLRGANLRGANLTGAALFGANLRGANLRGANLTDADWGQRIPKAPENLLQQIARAIRTEGALDMGLWHSPCGSAHCLAGWAVELTPGARAFERTLTTYVLGALLVPELTPYFYSTNEVALKQTEKYL